MNAEGMTLDQIQAAGLDALERELGPLGMVRFLQQFETGRGDYTKERHEWLDDADIASVLREIRERRSNR